MRDAPEKEHDRGSAGQRRHRINHQGCMLRPGEHREEARYHHEQRRSGRVSHFEFVRGCDEFAAIPETGRRLHGQQVDHRREDEAEPASDHIDFFKGIVHQISVGYFFNAVFRENV